MTAARSALAFFLRCRGLVISPQVPWLSVSFRCPLSHHIPPAALGMWLTDTCQAVFGFALLFSTCVLPRVFTSVSHNPTSDELSPSWGRLL